MNCPRCQTANATDAPFCVQCGLPLTAQAALTGITQPPSQDSATQDASEQRLTTPTIPRAGGPTLEMPSTPSFPLQSPHSPKNLAGSVSPEAPVIERAGSSIHSERAPIATASFPGTGQRAAQPRNPFRRFVSRRISAAPPQPLAAGGGSVAPGALRPVLGSEGRQTSVLQSGFAPEITPQRRPWPWGRTVAAVIVVALLAALVSFVRTEIHTAVDSQIALAMTAGVSSINGLTSTVHPWQVTADQVNAELASDLPAGTGLDHLAVAFHPGVAEVTYTTFGQTGTIRSGIAVQAGKLVLVNTQVTGILNWVENGDELAATADRALAKLQTPNGVESVVIAEGTVTITLSPPSTNG